ncbi:MAG: radical SAM protein [Candidatus Omnitrophica bacterium]|nr:radical SAM protein [Candidatus Omnitrophota bacterium]
MAASAGHKLICPASHELISLPQGSTFFYLPGRLPVGFDTQANKFQVVEKFQGKEVFALSVFMPPAYLRLYNPAALVKKKTVLPLWAYTACGVNGSRWYASAVRVDRRVRQSPRFYDDRIIKKNVKVFLDKFPGNRLYEHLSYCALNYNCLAAKNLFMTRWEAPLPTSQSCNARCLGCLSYQDSECLPSHQRINFRPQVNEIVEVMAHHLKLAPEAIVSFGQGCEGEPLLEADIIAESVHILRKNLSRGTINVNTNASLPKKIELLCKAGVDSFRVSLSSPQPKDYNAYFRPKKYSFGDVIASIDTAKKYKKFVSINLFVFPGFTDSKEQIESLVKLIKSKNINMVQLRNINIDPELYLSVLKKKRFNPQGIISLIEKIKRCCPGLKIGYFNLPKEQF